MIETRKLGWGLAALVVAGNMIGSGLYLLPATLAPIGSSSLISWIVCGVGALTLAWMFSGLGRFQPTADGLSDFAERGIGRFFGYQAALAYWAACVAGNVATISSATHARHPGNTGSQSNRRRTIPETSRPKASAPTKMLDICTLIAGGRCSTSLLKVGNHVPTLCSSRT